MVGPVVGGGGGSGGGSSAPSSSPSETASHSAAEQERGRARTSLTSDTFKTRFRKPFTLSGQITSDRTCAVSEVAIARRDHGTDAFVEVGRTQISSDGSWTHELSARRSASYIAQPVATELCDGVASISVDVLVHAKVAITRPRRCRAGAVVRGVVRPNHAGTKVRLENRRAGRWVAIDRDRLDAGSRFKGLKLGRCRSAYRVVWPPQDVGNLSGATRL